MKQKNNKKFPKKTKQVENNYEEKYNEVILNDLANEERIDDINTKEDKKSKRPRKNSLKFGFAKKNKKSNNSKENKEGLNKKQKKSEKEANSGEQPAKLKKRPKKNFKKRLNKADNKEEIEIKESKNLVDKIEEDGESLSFRDEANLPKGQEIEDDDF